MHRSLAFLWVLSFLSAGWVPAAFGQDQVGVSRSRPVAISEAVADLATTPGSDVTNARAIRVSIGITDVTPEDHGAVANDPAFDNTAPWEEASEAACALGVKLQAQPAARYYFKGTIDPTPCDRMVWEGDRTSLIYNGASATINLVSLADLVTGDGITAYREISIQGFHIGSLREMTAGAAFYCRWCVRSQFAIDIQSQDFSAEVDALGPTGDFGVRTWDGLWFDGTDNSRLDAKDINCNGTCLAVNGVAGEPGRRASNGDQGGPKADFIANAGKIANGLVGIRMGGAFGGLYLGYQTTLIMNQENLVIDTTLAPEGNREFFATGAIFDVALGNCRQVGVGCPAVESNIRINDGGDGGYGVRVNLSNIWVSAGQSHGIYVQRHTGVLALSNPRIVGNLGDAFRTDVANSGFANWSGGQAHGNGGYALNCTVNNCSVAYSGIQSFGNTAGDINGTFANTGATLTGPTTLRNPTLDGRMAFAGNAYVGPDERPARNPSVQWDADDRTYYDRSDNSLADVIDGDVALRVQRDRVILGDNVSWSFGDGSPEGVISANPGSLYSDAGGGRLYVKESGRGATGWVIK